VKTENAMRAVASITHAVAAASGNSGGSNPLVGSATIVIFGL
jgi:hypothetical protein